MPPLILITRPRQSAESFAEELRAELGETAEICIAPLLKIEHCAKLPDLAPIKTLIFTSAHAVESFSNATERRDFTCYAVGQATAEAAHERGFHSIAGPGTGKALADKILNDAPPPPCLHLRGDHVAFDVAQHLSTSGLPTQSAIVYRQVAIPLTEAAQQSIACHTPIIAPVFSPRSAKLLDAALPPGAQLHVAAISQAAAAPLQSARLSRLLIADRPDRAAMLKCVATLWHNAIQLEGDSTAQ